MNTGRIINQIFKYIDKLNLFFPMFLLVTSVLTIFQVSNYFYLVTDSPDFFHLSNYLKYGFGEIEYTNRDLGLAYFNLTNIFIFLQSEFITLTNVNHIIHNGVLLLNTSLYCLGLVGLYKFLINNKFQKNDVLWSFIIITFFPQTINMINTMKPEVFAFSMVTWVVYFVDNFLKTEKIFYLYYTLLPMSLIFTTKSSILFLSMGLFIPLFLKNFKKFFNLNVLFLFFLLTLIIAVLILENYKVNNFTIFQHVSSSSDGAYQNTASLKILYNINLKYLITLPFSNFHSDSLIGIVLLDTFGDYFNFWAYNDESLFVVNKIKIKQFWFLTHYSQFISIIFTIILYYLSFKFTRRYKNFSYLLLAPFIAIILLTLNSFGIPTKNYNPVTSDTFKTHYYSFLIIITFCLILIFLFQLNSKLKPIIFILIFISSTYLYGFPKYSNSEFQEYLEAKNSVTVFCSLNSFFVNSFESSKCKNFVYQVCNITRIINNTDSTNISENISIDYSYFTPLTLEKNNKTRSVLNKNDCITFVNNGYKPVQPFQKNLKLNFINLSIYIMYLISLFINKIFESRKKQKLKI